jgi:hypothetical protein
MSRLWAFLTAPEEAPKTQTCRIKRWAHDNAFTLYWAHVIEIALLAWLVWTCH